MTYESQRKLEEAFEWFFIINREKIKLVTKLPLN